MLRVPEWRDDIAAARAALRKLSQGARTLIFFGTGGSSLGGQTLAQLGGWNIPDDDKHGSGDEAAHALLRQSRRPHARARPCRSRPQDGALRRHLEVRRHPRDFGADHFRHRRRCARPAWQRASPSCSSPSPSPRQGASRTVSALCAKHSPSPSSIIDPKYRRPLLGPDQCRVVAGASSRPRRRCVERRRARRDRFPARIASPRTALPRRLALLSPSASPRNAACVPM